ncbi:MAG TPA: hypothetical protein VKU82_05000 [Planctomycetaceae bacterium]|nr:hypothetical protein [Planctomycetaceae bacterium]
MLPASVATEAYRCPGEAYSITRSVHLARLAAFYPKCRSCRHACAADGLPAPFDGLQEIAALQPQHSTPFNTEGIRGRHLNELTRSAAAELAGAMASCLWDDFSVARQAAHDVVDSANGVCVPAAGAAAPCVVIAFDERPSSPDMVTGVGVALQRMGCRVIDVGLATRPCFMFAIGKTNAAGGIYVTGAGCDPGWTGVDFVSRQGIPCSSPGDLDRIMGRYQGGFTRPSRRPGSYQAIAAAADYEGRLSKYFHALRPLRIALASSSGLVRGLFQRKFSDLACRLLPVETPTRRRTADDLTDPDFERISHRVKALRADLGVFVEDDGERCIFFDENGAIVAPQAAARLLAEIASLDYADSDREAEMAQVLPATWEGRIEGLSANSCPAPSLPRPTNSGCVFVAEPTREQITLAMRRHEADFAADGAGRYWFNEVGPACDAVLTVVHLLRALSQSDARFSESAVA